VFERIPWQSGFLSLDHSPPFQNIFNLAETGYRLNLYVQVCARACKFLHDVGRSSRGQRRVRLSFQDSSHRYVNSSFLINCASGDKLVFFRRRQWRRQVESFVSLYQKSIQFGNKVNHRRRVCDTECANRWQNDQSSDLGHSRTGILYYSAAISCIVFRNPLNCCVSKTIAW
jgi:hypothetical protein